MGATHVTVTIRNPATPTKYWEGLILVDTGETDSLVPREHLDRIGLKPKSQRIYELANGSKVRMDNFWRQQRRAYTRRDCAGVCRN